jgi:type IV secretory pathway component VirB8
MNLFKSAFSSSKNDQLQRSLDQLYDDVKNWDEARARSLQNHLKIV